MQRIIAIAWLTWKAALRFRLFLVIAVLLLAAVVGLPLIVKDDGNHYKLGVKGGSCQRLSLLVPQGF